MNQKKVVLLIVSGLIVLIAAMFLIEYFRGMNQAKMETDLKPGEIPIYWNGKFNKGFSIKQLDQIKQVSFVDAEEQKTQEGWLVKDILLGMYKLNQFTEDTTITIISSSRNKSATITWQEINNLDNMVMFDLSGRGTLKLVSKLERLDIRDEWIQDVDKIEVSSQ